MHCKRTGHFAHVFALFLPAPQESAWTQLSRFRAYVCSWAMQSKMLDNRLSNWKTLPCVRQGCTAAYVQWQGDCNMVVCPNSISRQTDAVFPFHRTICIMQ